MGAGFQLASHDLDIRGAGNLLGDEQSGHIREVGIELYQHLLEEAVADARIRKLIPVALADAAHEQGESGAAAEKAERTGTVISKSAGPAKAPWQTDPNSWYQMREELAGAMESQK